jgi:hypothetical protein
MQKRIEKRCGDNGIADVSSNAAERRSAVRIVAAFDLHLNFHPSAIRVSADFTPSGAM